MRFLVNAVVALNGFRHEISRRGAEQGLPALGREAGLEAVKHIGAAAEHTKEWAVKNPGKAGAVASSIVASPIMASLALPIIGAVGFGSGGVAAGSAAALIQSSIPNVASGSLFAFLQSAGAGGAGAGILSSSVFAGTSVAGWCATVPFLIRASQEGEGNKVKEKDKEQHEAEHYVIHLEDKDGKD